MDKSARRSLAAAATTVCTLFTGALVAPGAEALPPSGTAGMDRLSDLISGHDRQVHGRRAVEMLAGRLPEAAQRNGMAAGHLRELLVEDPSAWLDADAQLYYQEPARTEGATSAATAAAAATAPLSQTFLLHSKPGSQRTIYLDFDGHDVTGTVWNEGHRLAPGFYPAWSLDTNRSAFSSAEREAVQSVWQRVAEDYAPFDVDVTTQDPGAAAINRTSTADQVYGTRALVSPSNSAVNKLCDGSCGGLAYIGVFDMSGSANYQPAWIFPQRLGNDTKSIAESVSHEVGHTFGLTHDGVTGGTGYYGGHDTWAPIMGVGFSRPITQWSKGDYTGANNPQDDLAVISTGGAPLLPDEAGGTTASATRPPWGTAYITTNADRDVYALGTCSGPVSLDVEPVALSPNLDLELTLLKSNGNVASANPPSRAGTPARDKAVGLDATITQDLNAATYFVAVDGVGNGTPTAGYDGYASVGGYTMTVNGNCSDGRATPSAPQGVTAAAANGSSVSVRWSAPSSPGGSAITHYIVTRTGAEPVTTTGLSHTFTGLTPGRGFAFTVAAVNASGSGPASGASAATPNLPGAPGSVRGGSGSAGGKVTAVAKWKAPLSNGGAGVNGFRVYGYRLNDRGAVVQTVTSSVRGPDARSWRAILRKGRWKFSVRARNAVGWGHLSPRSKPVTAR
jgi:Fibronectin type III domain/Metallo-peptidase family M12B Reprolysin-like